MTPPTIDNDQSKAVAMCGVKSNKNHSVLLVAFLFSGSVNCFRSFDLELRQISGTNPPIGIFQI